MFRFKCKSDIRVCVLCRKYVDFYLVVLFKHICGQTAFDTVGGDFLIDNDF